MKQRTLNSLLSYKFVAVLIICLTNLQVLAAPVSTIKTSLNVTFENEQLLPSTVIHTYSMPLSILIEKNSRWNLQLIEEETRYTELIMGKCGISIYPITIQFFKMTPLKKPLGPENDYLLTQKIPNDLQRPIAIFVKKTSKGYGEFAYANPEFYIDHPHEQFSLNTMFLSELRIDFRKTDKDYQRTYLHTIAHELGHILLNSNHVDLPGNIMDGNPLARGDFFSDAQCAIMRKHSLVKKVK